jgi:hypothetical protein
VRPEGCQGKLPMTLWEIEPATCSAVPQPTAPPRAPASTYFQKSRIMRNSHNVNYEEGRVFSFCKEQILSRVYELLSGYKKGCATVNLLYRKLELPIRQMFVRKTVDFGTGLYRRILRSD